MRLKSLAFFSGLLALAAAFLLPAASADAAMLSTQNSVVVLRVGDGTTALSSTAAAVFLEEYSISYAYGKPTSATHVQTIPVPATGTDEGTKLTIGGTAALEGGLNFSTNGQYLMFAGHNSFVDEMNSGKRKIVGRLDLNGNVELDAIYGAGTTSSGNVPRTVASLTGNEYWFGMSANPGIGYRTWENGNNSGVSATSVAVGNWRRVEIFNGQLYVDSAAGSVFGVATVGSGTPTTTLQTVTILPGMPTTTGPSPYDFFFADANTIYIADDRTSVAGGLQKWVFDSDSGNWSLIYTANIATANSANGLRGLTGSVDADGNVTLFSTTTFLSNATANFLVGISDTLANTSAANVTFNSLASSASIPGAGGSLATFRGLEAIGIVTIPEPASLGLLAIGGLLMLSARRRKA